MLRPNLICAHCLQPIPCVNAWGRPLCGPCWQAEERELDREHTAAREAAEGEERRELWGAFVMLVAWVVVMVLWGGL